MTRQKDLKTLNSEFALQLLNITLQAESLSDSKIREIFVNQIHEIKKISNDGSQESALQLLRKIKWSIRRYRLINFFFPNVRTETDMKVVSLIKGFSYCAIALFIIGICVVVYVAIDRGLDENNLGVFKYLFIAVRELKIEPKHYLFGLFGAAGAVTSIVKRLDQLVETSDSAMKFFLIGLLNPVIGAVVAVVACTVAPYMIPTIQKISADVSVGKTIYAGIGFFAGYSERLLERVQPYFTGEKSSA